MEKNKRIKKFIPKDLAYELSLLGYNENCMGYWNKYLPEVIFSADDSWVDFAESTKYNVDETSGDFLAPMYDDVIDWFLETHNIIISALPLRDKTVNPERIVFMPSVFIKGIDSDIYEDPWDVNTVILDRYESLQTAIKEGIKLIKIENGRDRQNS